MLLVVAGLPVLIATAAVLLRAVRRTEDRAGWLALGLALAAQTVGTVLLALPGGGSHFPRGADVILVTFFPLTFAAALLFARARLRRFGLALWLDAALGALGAAAIVTQLLGVEVDRVTGGGWASAVALAYPMGDVMLVVLVVVAMTLRGGRPSAVWLLLAAGLLSRVVGDIGYVAAGLDDEQRPLWVPLFGLASPVLIAIAAWVRAPQPRQVALAGRRMLITPSLLALVAGGLLVLDHFRETTDAAVWLSGATLVAVLGRMALTYHENTALHASRELALTDELTGLANRRLFHERLKEELGSGRTARRRWRSRWSTSTASRSSTTRSATTPATGCWPSSARGCNDVVGDAGLVARLGGDEFALLLPGAGLAAASELGAPARRDAADAVRDRRPRGRDGRQRRRRAVPGQRRRRRLAAAARRRRDVPGQGGAHGLSGLRPDARPPLARAAGADGRAAARARARRADPALPAQGRSADRARRRRRGARALAAPGPRPARAGRVPPARRAHRADAAADPARARDRALAARAVADRRARPARRRQPGGTEPARPAHPGARGGAAGAPRAAAARCSRSRSPSR